jgi:hypothetical protein
MEHEINNESHFRYYRRLAFVCAYYFCAGHRQTHLHGANRGAKRSRLYRLGGVADVRVGARVFRTGPRISCCSCDLHSFGKAKQREFMVWHRMAGRSRHRAVICIHTSVVSLAAWARLLWLRSCPRNHFRTPVVPFGARDLEINAGTESKDKGPDAVNIADIQVARIRVGPRELVVMGRKRGSKRRKVDLWPRKAFCVTHVAGISIPSIECCHHRIRKVVEVMRPFFVARGAQSY